MAIPLKLRLTAPPTPQPGTPPDGEDASRSTLRAGDDIQGRRTDWTMADTTTTTTATATATGDKRKADSPFEDDSKKQKLNEVPEKEEQVDLSVSPSHILSPDAERSSKPTPGSMTEPSDVVEGGAEPDSDVKGKGKGKAVQVDEAGVEEEEDEDDDDDESEEEERPRRRAAATKPKGFYSSEAAKAALPKDLPEDEEDDDEVDPNDLTMGADDDEESEDEDEE